MAHMSRTGRLHLLKEDIKKLNALVSLRYSEGALASSCQTQSEI